MATRDALYAFVRSFWAFFSGASLSRLTGLLRDIAMASLFGTHPSIAAFMVAFRFSHLLRRLLGEGPFAASCIPHFEQERLTSPRSAALFFRDLFALLLLFLSALILIVELAGYWLLHSSLLGERGSEILKLTLVMLPSLLFICLAGLSNAIVQCQGGYFLSGAAPAAFNGVWIVGAYLWSAKPPTEAAYLLAWTVVLACLVQWAMLMRAVGRSFASLLSWRDWWRRSPFSADLKRIVRPIGYMLVGVGAVQINSAVDALFACRADGEAPAYLWYAIRLEQLPLALFGIALASILLPSLSRSFATGALASCRGQLRFAMRSCCALLLPVTLGIFALGRDSIDLIYGRGFFSAEAVDQTTLCLWGYGLGLLPAALVILFSSAFNAMRDFRTPMRASLSSILLHLLLNSAMILLLGWGAASIAVATSLSAVWNSALLMRSLQKQLGPLWEREDAIACLKVACASLCAGGALLLVSTWGWGESALSLLLQGAHTSLAIELSTGAKFVRWMLLALSFGAVFLGMLWALKLDDLRRLVQLGRRRRAVDGVEGR